MNTPKFLGVAVAITGRVFAHPADLSDEAIACDRAARERGDYPYAHLWEGDDAAEIVADMRREAQERQA